MNKWYGISLFVEDWTLLCKILKEKGFQYEASCCGVGMVHVEINCNEEESKYINNIIQSLGELTAIPQF